MKEQREIVLPPHLFDRIKASAGEHGGMGGGGLFTGTPGDVFGGFPLCAHGHAWGTADRRRRMDCYLEPELKRYLATDENDRVMSPVLGGIVGARIPFEQWCKLLNVKRGVEVAKEVIVERETVTV